MSFFTVSAITRENLDDKKTIKISFSDLPAVVFLIDLPEVAQVCNRIRIGTRMSSDLFKGLFLKKWLQGWRVVVLPKPVVAAEKVPAVENTTNHRVDESRIGQKRGQDVVDGGVQTVQAKRVRFAEDDASAEPVMYQHQAPSAFDGDRVRKSAMKKHTVDDAASERCYGAGAPSSTSDASATYTKPDPPPQQLPAAVVSQPVIKRSHDQIEQPSEQEAHKRARSSTPNAPPRYAQPDELLLFRQQFQSPAPPKPVSAVSAGEPIMRPKPPMAQASSRHAADMRRVQREQRSASTSVVSAPIIANEDPSDVTQIATEPQSVVYEEPVEPVKPNAEANVAISEQDIASPQSTPANATPEPKVTETEPATSQLAEYVDTKTRSPETSIEQIPEEVSPKANIPATVLRIEPAEPEAETKSQKKRREPSSAPPAAKQTYLQAFLAEQEQSTLGEEYEQVLTARDALEEEYVERTKRNINALPHVADSSERVWMTWTPSKPQTKKKQTKGQLAKELQERVDLQSKVDLLLGRGETAEAQPEPDPTFARVWAYSRPQPDEPVESVESVEFVESVQSVQPTESVKRPRRTFSQVSTVAQKSRRRNMTKASSPVSIASELAQEPITIDSDDDFTPSIDLSDDADASRAAALNASPTPTISPSATPVLSFTVASENDGTPIASDSDDDDSLQLDPAEIEAVTPQSWMCCAYELVEDNHADELGSSDWAAARNVAMKFFLLDSNPMTSAVFRAFLDHFGSRDVKFIGKEPKEVIAHFTHNQKALQKQAADEMKDAIEIARGKANEPTLREETTNRKKKEPTLQADSQLTRQTRAAAVPLYTANGTRDRQPLQEVINEASPPRARRARRTTRKDSKAEYRRWNEIRQARPKKSYYEDE